MGMARTNRLTTDNSELIRKLGGSNNFNSSDGTVLQGLGSAQSSNTYSLVSSEKDRRFGTGVTAGFRGTGGTGGFGTLPSVLEEVKQPDENENDKSDLRDLPEIKIESATASMASKYSKPDREE